MRLMLPLTLFGFLLTSAPAEARGRFFRRTCVCPPPPREVASGGLHAPCVGKVRGHEAPRSPSAEAAIRTVLAEQVTAWNKGDLVGFMEGYWRSPDLSFSSGADQTRGWQQTLDRYRKRYQSEGQEMGKLTFSELTVEMLGTDSALVRGRWQLIRTKDKPGGIFTLILKRFPEGWRIVHDHTS